MKGYIEINVSKSSGVIKSMDSSKCTEYIFVSVKDTGVGIEEEKKKQMFKMFGKLENTNNLNSHGVGFGLTICKELVEAMKGALGFSSQFGTGS
jgi:signal transduction histidine kinase